MPGISRVPPDLYAAIGDAETAEVTVRFQLSRGPATGVSGSVFYRFVVSDLNFDGTIDDLFDWDRDLTIGFPWGRMNISAFPRLGSMARAGADIQAAHLGKGSSRSGGMIFLNSYLLNGTLPGFAFEDVK